MELELKLRLIGNSLVITIPAQVVKTLKLKQNDMMLLDVEDSNIIVKKKKTS